MITTYDFEALAAELESRLKPSRFAHSLGVASEAARLAERFSVPVEQARIAGLLHDCAREFANEDLPKEAELRGISYGEVERAMPLLLHAYVGAKMLPEVYGVTDSAIQQAVWRHTVGGSRMTKLDKIIYFADMIEPSRAYPEVEELRRLSYEATLDEMLLKGLSESIIFVIRQNHLVHPDTVRARNELLLKYEDKT